MNFKSKAAYNAWLAYGHASGEFAKTPGNQPVSIKGKSHGVQHKKGGKLKKENNTNNEFGNIDIAPEGTREYQIANQPKASEYEQQYVDKAIEAAKLMYQDFGIYDEDDFLWSKMQSAVNPSEVFKLAKNNVYTDAYGKDRRDQVDTSGARYHGSQIGTTLMRYFDAAIPPNLYPHEQGSAGYGSDIYNKKIEEPVRREFTQSAMPTLQHLPLVNLQYTAPNEEAINPYSMNSQKKSFAFGGAMYAAGGSFNNPGFAKLPKDVQAKIKARSFASGGPMAQLTEFNEGGRHEENPIGGIPQGFAPDGQPNLVEQGETKLNGDNYIYSDTLKVTKDIALDFSLPKNSVGKTFAEVSKEANRPKSRRENDTIETVAIKRDLDNLMQAQEEFKKRDLEKDMQMMMEKHPQEMQQMMAGAQGAPQGMPQEGMAPGQEMQGPPQEMAPEQQVPQSAEMGMPQGQPMDPSQMSPEMLAQMEGAQQGQPVMRMGGNIYMCGGKMYDFGGWMNENNNTIGGAAKGAMSGAATGASIGLNPALLAATGGLSAAAIPIGAAIGGIASGIKGSKADKAENAADAEAARLKTSQSQAINANALMPDMNNVVNTPYQETINPMGMMGKSYDAGGWMNNNANTIGSTGEGFMAGAATGLEAGKQFDVEGQTPWGSIIGAGVGAIGGGIGGVASGRQEDEQARMQQQAMYDQGKMQRNQSNMMINAPQMYQQQMMNQMNGAQMAKYGGRQYPTGGPISTYQMTPAMFAKEFPSYNYKTELQGYNNNPKNSAGVPIQGGDYVSLTPQQRADAIKYYESLPQNKIGAQEWASYQHLNSSAPYFVDKSFNTAYDPATSWSSGQIHYLNQPIDLTKYLYNAPAAPAGTPPAPTSTGLPQIDIDNGPMVDVKPEQFAFKPAVEHMYDAAGNKTGTQTISAADVQKRFAAGENNAAMSPYWSSDRNSDGEQVPGNTGTSYFNQVPSMFRTQTDTEGNKMLTGYGGTGPGAKGANAPVTLQTPVAIPGSFAYGGNLRSRSYAAGGAMIDPPGTPLTSLGTTHPVTGVAANTGYEWALNPYYDDQLKFYNEYQAELAKDPNYNPAPTVAMGTVESLGTGVGPGDQKWMGKKAPEKYVQLRLSNTVPPPPPPATSGEGVSYKGIKRTDAYGRTFTYDASGNKVYVSNAAGTTPASGNFAMGGMLPEDEGMARLDRELDSFSRMNGGFLSSPGLHSYAMGGSFEGDPVKGETRITDKGITQVYNGTEWQEITGDINSQSINSDLGTNYLTSNQQNNPELQNKEAANYDYIKEYQRKLHAADEKLTDKNLDLEINQSLPEFLASAAPAAYNLGQGIFGKAQQLNPRDYMINANMQPYQYNINPQLREADQSFAQGQEAIRNAGLGGGSYAANMQQLANSRNQTIGGLYAQKQNADAESYNQAMSQNKAIEAQNLERKMGIQDFNLKSKAAKTAMLQAGLTQLAQVSEGSQSKKLQLALMKALAPDFAGTMAYNSIADQYLNKMKEKKKAKTTK